MSSQLCYCYCFGIFMTGLFVGSPPPPPCTAIQPDFEIEQLIHGLRLRRPTGSRYDISCRGTHPLCKGRLAEPQSRICSAMPSGCCLCSQKSRFTSCGQSHKGDVQRHKPRLRIPTDGVLPQAAGAPGVKSLMEQCNYVVYTPAIIP